MARYMSASMGAAEMNRSPISASRGSGGRFHSMDTIAPAPAKPTAPHDRMSSHTSLGWNAPASTLVPPTSMGASTVGAALRWNSGIAVHSTSPASSSHVDATVAAAVNRYAHVVATAFDGPEVPDVKNSATSSGSAAAPEGGSIGAAFNSSLSESPCTNTDLSVS